MAITQAEMIERVAAVAIELRVGGSKIFPSVRLAQAILETGGAVPPWNNLFGIKVGTGTPNAYWDGRFVDRTTREVLDGQVYEDVAVQWRYYRTLEDSVRDHEQFLQKALYAPVRAAATPYAQCLALYASGYATDAPTEVDGDPSYGEKLWAVIQSRGLLRYDAEAVRLGQEIEARLSRLEADAGSLDGRVDALEDEAVRPAPPDWARDAVNAAVASGLVNTPNGGSYDFYRILTVMKRRGLL
ncbi:glycoside hydrolase family 73 protein [Gorillibacterium sp. sgz5001074]|uniref:glycoside hydrolase family 73 protein n=1 Tax=Gorillibacterium sp. sgz5001074 TaxID=3446695 RepID=UPI003F674C98